MSKRSLVFAALLPFAMACDRDVLAPENRALTAFAVPQSLFATTGDYGPPVLLPTLGDHRSSEAVDVNAAGTILGIVSTWTSTHAVVWNDGVIAELLAPAGWDNWYESNWRINATGAIAATRSDADWTIPNRPERAFLIRAGSAEALEPLPGYDHSGANAINDHGWVAGTSSGDWGLHDRPTAATLWIDGVATEVPLSRVIDMNNSGAILGLSSEWDVVIYRDGTVTTVGQWWVETINDAGQVPVGRYEAGAFVSYVWENGTTTPILGPPGTEGWNVWVPSINNAGVAVGQAWTDAGQTVNFLWQNGSAVALAEADGYVSWPWRINDSGVIVGGMYTDDNWWSSTAAVWYPTRTHYAFGGFLRPVDNPPVVNRVRAGSAVPMKFSLGGDQGMGILAGAPQSVPIVCDNAAPLDSAEETASAGSSGLSYDPVLDVYTYVWKTERAWAGTCRMFSLSLDDGSVHHAIFNLSR